MTSLVNTRSIRRMGHVSADYNKFLFLSMQGCFTDIHVNMSGTSVHNYIYSGKKDCYFAKPTKENLDLFKKYEKDRIGGNKWLRGLLKGQWRKVELRIFISCIRQKIALCLAKVLGEAYTYIGCYHQRFGITPNVDFLNQFAILYTKYHGAAGREQFHNVACNYLSKKLPQVGQEFFRLLSHGFQNSLTLQHMSVTFA
ncbi:hypothetical protein CAEBREN_21837 [Caenorhabditis brenneri]|uniref:Uncharacterized protein n=1 Tax=Caenorhabditis brenneri TaxID=135651 RepID=G0NVK7_CAEBE|nr:hypothetical protein CAEBREN_21837 [Caenorhabditis brenneri]